MMRASRFLSAAVVAGSRTATAAPSLKLPNHRYVVSDADYRMPHMTYVPNEVEQIDQSRRPPQGIRDRLAYIMIRFTRKSFDLITNYNERKMTKRKWVNRALFLESVAGVPGMVGGMVRHLQSLRCLKRDHGWIHHLLEEAENERMHLFFFLREKNPGVLFRLAIAITQAFFFNLHFATYLLSPKFMHRFVGYLEEEAVHTYTIMLKDIDSEKGSLAEWRTKLAPEEMARYYNLKVGEATYRDIILCIRADELGHREYNHLFADIHGTDTEDKLVTEKVELVKAAQEKAEIAQQEEKQKQQEKEDKAQQQKDQQKQAGSSTATATDSPKDSKSGTA